MNKKEKNLVTELDHTLSELQPYLSYTKKEVITSRNSWSIYYCISYRNRRILNLRVSNHTCTPKSSIIPIQIGNYYGSDYTLNNWYLVLLDIDKNCNCLEVKASCKKMLALFKTRAKTYSKNFENTLNNIRSKKKNYIDSIIEFNDILKQFIDTFNLKYEVIKLNSIIKLQYKHNIPLVLFISSTVPYYQEWAKDNTIILIGSYSTSHFNLTNIKDIIRSSFFKLNIEIRYKNKLEKFLKSI